MKKRKINDMDHYCISEDLKKGNKRNLIQIQRLMIEEFGKEECLLYSDLAHFKEHKRKKPIKFPFVEDAEMS